MCLERGWREYNESSPLKDGWNLWWRTGGFPINHYKQLKPWQVPSMSAQYLLLNNTQMQIQMLILVIFVKIMKASTIFFNHSKTLFSSLTESLYDWSYKYLLKVFIKWISRLLLRPWGNHRHKFTYTNLRKQKKSWESWMLSHKV